MNRFLQEIELTLRGPDGACLWSWVRVAHDASPEGFLSLFNETARDASGNGVAHAVVGDRFVRGDVVVGSWRASGPTDEVLVALPSIPEDVLRDWLGAVEAQAGEQSTGSCSAR